MKAIGGGEAENGEYKKKMTEAKSIWQGSDQNESGFWQWRIGGNDLKWRQSSLENNGVKL
jgi:hypothetical protein